MQRLANQSSAPSRQADSELKTRCCRALLEELLDDDDELAQLNLSSRPLREDKKRNRDRERLKRGQEWCVLSAPRPPPPRGCLDGHMCCDACSPSILLPGNMSLTMAFIECLCLRRGVQ